MASIDLPCDWKSGFIMDPTKKQRCGYLTTFSGLDLGTEPTTKDDAYLVRVFTPFPDEKPNYTKAEPVDQDGLKVVKCVGILDSFSWGGGAGDPISISAYVSTEFANQIMAKQKTALTTTAITGLGWWIVNYDTEEKAWYEEAYPMGEEGIVKGQLNAHGGKDVALHVADEPTMIMSSLDVQVFHMSFEIVPGANTTYVLGFSQAKSKPYVKGWGLQVGGIAKGKLDKS